METSCENEVSCIKIITILLVFGNEFMCTKMSRMVHCSTYARSTHENLFTNFYIINLPSIIGIQFIDGVGEIDYGRQVYYGKIT